MVRKVRKRVLKVGLSIQERMRHEKISTVFLTITFSIGFIILLSALGFLSQTLIKEQIAGKAVVTEECDKGIVNISFWTDYNFIPGKNYSVLVAAYHGGIDNKLCERKHRVIDWENVSFSSLPVSNIDQIKAHHQDKKENLVIDMITNSGIKFSMNTLGKKLHSEETYLILIQDLDCQPTKCKKHKDKCHYKTDICCDVDDKDTWLEMDDFYNFSHPDEKLYKKDCLDYTQCVTKIVSPKIHLKNDKHHYIDVNSTFIGESGNFTVIEINKLIPLKCLNCTDDDLDGYSMEGGMCGLVDCDDADASMHPGAPEICNGLDDNCNGLDDEGCLYAPTVSITMPYSGAEFKRYTPITFYAAASDFDGNITSYSWTSNKDGVIGNSQSFIISSLSVGAHLIKVTVTDTDGLKASANITVIIEDPDSPIVSIISPNNGDTFVQGTPVNFVGSAVPQGNAVISSIAYASSVDGIIFSSTNITSFSTSSLSAGMHTITLFATDNHGKTASYLIKINIKEADAPSASIISPISKQFGVGQNIVFGGSATPHGGAIVSQEWASNREGFLGAGQTINVSSLSVGLHAITYAVTDSNGKTGTDTIMIEIIDNDAPVASILLPSDNEQFKSGSKITFSGIGDQENITSYTWYSDINGLLSHSQIFSTSSLHAGKHEITLLVEDDDSQTGMSTITIYVMPPLAPKVSIISPLDESDYRTGQTIYFIGSSSDPDGNITSYSWISSIDGTLSSLDSFSTSGLSLGDHIITFTATDDDNKTGTSSVKISVKPIQAPTASIVKPNNGDHFRQFDSIEFIGSGSDPDGYITEWIWSSSIDGVFGNEQNLNTSCLSLGKHDITLTVIDNDGLKYIDTFTIWIEIDPLNAPDIFFDSPASGTYKQGESLFFDASHSAIDSWKVTSSLDGVIKSANGNFVPFNYSNLSLGHHYLTVEVFKRMLSNSATVEVWIVSTGSPNVTINSPASGAYDYGTSLIFNASIVGSWTSIIWNSNLDGNFGNSPEFVYSLLTPGKHLISAIVTNSDNKTTIVQATITILPPPVIPFCGDGTCNAGETCSTCPSDCGSCAGCGDGTCNAGETCSTCSVDCGSCGGGGGGGGGGGRMCTELWSCGDWGSCIAGTRTRTCTDLNNCGTASAKPAESEPCVVTPILPAPSPAPTPVPAPVPAEKKCPSSLFWIITAVAFIIMLIIMYLVLRSIFLELYTSGMRKTISKVLYTYVVIFLIFLLAVCISCKTNLYVIPMAVVLAVIMAYTHYKDEIAAKLFLGKHWGLLSKK